MSPERAGEGYGYLWWIGATGSGLFNGVDVGAGSFAAEGSGGHIIAVLPAYDMVIVSRADDAYYRADEAAHDIGPNRLGALVAIVLGAKE
jgi:CubicO group peptidase (beta-lactamase class C family)